MGTISKINDFYVTNFYNIRNLPSNYLPVSINSGEPSWFYDKKRGNVYKDKRGIVNGFYIKELNMNCVRSPLSCNDCKRRPTPFSSSFPCITTYLHYLYLKQLPFSTIYDKLLSFISFANTNLDVNVDTICFVVFEKRWDKCGEAIGVKRYFEDNHIKIKDYYSDTPIQLTLF